MNDTILDRKTIMDASGPGPIILSERKVIVLSAIFASSLNIRQDIVQNVLAH